MPRYELFFLAKKHVPLWMDVIHDMLINHSSPRHDRRDANDVRCSGPK